MTIALNRYQVILRSSDDLFSGAVSAFISSVNSPTYGTRSTGERESLITLPLGAEETFEFAPQGVLVPVDDDPEPDASVIGFEWPVWDWEVWDRENPDPWIAEPVEAAEYEVIPPTFEPAVRVYEPPVATVEVPQVVAEVEDVVTEIPTPEVEEMAVDWGDIIGGVAGELIQGWTGADVTGFAPVTPTSSFVGGAAPVAGTIGSCPPRKTRTLTIDCATGREIKRTRRRRRRLLTEGDFNDLMRIATLPNKQNVTVALAKAVGRR